MKIIMKTRIEVCMYVVVVVVVVVAVVFSHELLSKNLESVVTQSKGAGALRISEERNEIEIRPGNTTLSRLKTHDTKKGAQVKRSNMQTELTWPRVSAQLQHRVSPFPQLTNSRLQTTAVGLPAPYEPQGNREHGRTRLLSGVLSE